MMMSCSQFTFDGDPDYMRLCTCPICKGFLPRRFPIDKQFLCRKCGAVLKVYPSLDEYMSWDQFLFDPWDVIRWGGRICAVPALAIKISTVLPPRPMKRHRKKTEMWALGGGIFSPGNYVAFSRRVWKDREGEFIEVGSEMLDLADERIVQVVGQ
jgi:hypothetical protein